MKQVEHVNALVEKDSAARELDLVSPIVAVTDAARFAIRAFDISHVSQSPGTHQSFRSSDGRMKPMIKTKHQAIIRHSRSRIGDPGKVLPVTARRFLAKNPATSA